MTKYRPKDAFHAQRLLMIVAGVWPIDNPPLIYDIFGFIISFLIQNMFIIPSLLLFVVSSVDVAQGSFIMFCNIAAVCYQLKLGVFCVKRKTFRQILEDLEQPLFQTINAEHEQDIQNAIALAKRIRFVMYIPSFLFAMLLPIYPALDHTTERPLPFSLPFDINHVSYRTYMVIYGMEALAGGIATLTNTNLDTLACTLMILGSVQLKILGKKLKMILESNREGVDDMENYKKFDDIVKGNLRACVMHHIAITEYVQKLEETFTYEYLAQFITGLLLICVAGFSFIVIPITDAMFVTAFSFFSIASVEMAIYCIFGNQIIALSTDIRDCCYLSKWNQFGPSICKTLMIMMERTKRPLVLSAGKFAYLSHESLISILRSSFSYFVVIRKLYVENRS